MSTRHLSGALEQLLAALVAGTAVYLAACAALGVGELALLRKFWRPTRA